MNANKLSFKGHICKYGLCVRSSTFSYLFLQFCETNGIDAFSWSVIGLFRLVTSVEICKRAEHFDPFLFDMKGRNLEQVSADAAFNIFVCMRTSFLLSPHYDCCRSRTVMQFSVHLSLPRCSQTYSSARYNNLCYFVNILDAYSVMLKIRIFPLLNERAIGRSEEIFFLLSPFECFRIF